MTQSIYSLIIPVYKNEPSVPALLIQCEEINAALQNRLEVVFVVDGSPDRSYEILKSNLVGKKFRSQLIKLSKNFGSFIAVRIGLEAAQGNFFSVMAADLQEPSELPVEIFNILSTSDVDLVVGQRESREDPFFSRIFSSIFWGVLKRFVFPDLPKGGVDIFGCSTDFRNALLKLKETNSSLIGQLFWLGFEKKIVTYKRKKRQHGKSSWSFSKRFNYLLDSLYSFSDIPIRVLTLAGALGLFLSLSLSLFIICARVFAQGIVIPGYAATASIILFFAGLNSFGLGVIGGYVWRAFENTKGRPNGIIQSLQKFD